MNYFELFGLPVRLQVDRAELNRRYIALQKKYHPDFFTQASEEEQRDALEQSSRANKGLKVLQAPDEVIGYVLQLKGIMTADEKYRLPQEFLLEMMEVNEQLTEDPGAAREGIARLEAELEEQVQPMVDGYQDDQATAEELLLLKEYYFKKKYLQRILDRMDD